MTKRIDRTKGQGMAALVVYSTISTSGERIERLDQHLANLGLERHIDDPEAIDDAVSDILAHGYLAGVADGRKEAM